MVNVRSNSGYTLFELLTVLVIMSILLLIAIPSYQSFIQQEHRSLAKQSLIVCAGKLMAEKARNGSLADLLSKESKNQLEGLCSKQVPEQGTAHYQLNIKVESKDGAYTLVADPVSGLAQEDGQLSLTWLGLGCRKTATESCMVW